MSRWVYPRACGGTPITGPLAGSRRGLSPRLRGNRVLDRHGISIEGSIPAPAGEPLGQEVGPCRYAVYPRACGGTLRVSIVPAQMAGLSPRLRGNRWRPPRPCRRRGSIPAPAGEPGEPINLGEQHAVYPRACGGTPGGRTARVGPQGLSPRLRGNPNDARIRGDRRGSIPAPAGEPGATSGHGTRGTVYPRACGGTSMRSSPVKSMLGLSPRLRGNRGSVCPDEL